MDAILEHINSAGNAFVNFAIPMLVQSSVLIVVLLGLDLLLRKKIRAVFRYWIWMIILLKLILPTTLSAPTGPVYWFGDELHEVVARQSIEPASPKIAAPIVETVADTPTIPEVTLAARTVESVGVDPGPTAPAEAVVATRPAVPAPAIGWQGSVLLLWLAVVTTMTLLLAQRAFFVRGLIAQSKDAGAEILGIFERGREQMKVRRCVALRLSPVAASPSVCGLLRPTILIPQGLAERLDSTHLRSIILHELAHIKRGDLWVSLFQAALQIVYVYNPLLWVANAMIRKIREAAVDETVLAAMGEQAEDYPRTLLDVSRLTFSRPALSLRLIGVVESKKALAGRIKHMASKPFPNTAKLGIVGLLTVIVVAAVLLPMARAQKEDAPALSSAEPPSEAVLTTVSGIVTNKLGRPRGNVHIAPQSANIWRGIRSGAQGRFVLEDVKPGQRNWVAFSQASRAMGLFTIPQTYAGEPLGVTLNFSEAEVEGRIVGADGKGMADRKVEFMIKTDRGIIYRVPCYGKTDQHGNYSHGIIPCGSGLSIQARLADANEDEKEYVTQPLALRDRQIFIPMPRLVVGSGEPEETDDGKVLYGGRVVSEQGKPISGAEVHVSYRWRGSMGIWSKDLMTDEDGRWKRRLPKDLSNPRVGLLHPEYVVKSGQRPSQVELLNGTSILVMKRGLHLSGIVRDQQGKPINDAVIDTGGCRSTTPYGEMIENCTSPRTSADGSFSVGCLAQGSKDIVVSAVGHAPQIVPLEIDEGMEPIEVRLKRGKTYLGQVVDAEANPIEGVKIDVGDWEIGRKRARLTRITQTDSQGRFRIENLPDQGKVRLDFGKRSSGFLGFSKDIPDDLSGRDEIVMHRTPVFAGTVVDAVSGEPIADFKLTCGIQSSAFGDRLTWSTHYKNDVTSEDGAFKKTWSGYHITLPFDGVCCLKVEAKGYLHGSALPAKLGEKYEPCVVRLTKADPFTGVIVDREGNPAVKAQVGWVGPERFAFLKNGKFDTMGYSYQAEPIVKTDLDGVFEVPPSREKGLIVAVHKSGYASVESKDFENGSQIRLTPWARIEGTIAAGDKNAGEFVFGISEAPPPEGYESQSIRWMFDRTSFSGKNFVVDFVPSTPLHIGRIVQSRQESPVYIDPRPGQTYEIRFEGEDITVAGRKIPSLLGKTLPDLKDISVVFSPSQQRGKAILMCFWDMNQRPSRNCVVQLAGRAEELAQKGVTIVSIHASETDEKTLDTWVTDADIPFPVGTIPADHEQTRFAWGVRSLPWLILTDKSHVIRAEGFRLSDLDGILLANN